MPRTGFQQLILRAEEAKERGRLNAESARYAYSLVQATFERSTEIIKRLRAIDNRLPG